MPQILSNFGVDVLAALSSSCTLYTMGQQRLPALVCDALIAFLITVLHSLTLMCQAIVFSVALNSKRNALLALMIAANFVEIKGTVYKKMDAMKLWSVAQLVSGAPAARNACGCAPVSYSPLL